MNRLLFSVDAHIQQNTIPGVAGTPAARLAHKEQELWLYAVEAMGRRFRLQSATAEECQALRLKRPRSLVAVHIAANTALGAAGTQRAQLARKEPET